MLPRGLEGLGEGAANIAGQAAKPVTDRIESIRQQAFTREGLTHIAFVSSGHDPAVAVTTGIALGVAALGVGVGAKGMSAALGGIKNMLVKDKGSRVETREESIPATLDDAVKLLQVNKNILKEFRSQTYDQLGMLVDMSKEQLKFNEAILTNAARERLEKARAQSDSFETSLESNRIGKETLEATKRNKLAEEYLLKGKPGDKNDSLGHRLLNWAEAKTGLAFLAGGLGAKTTGKTVNAVLNAITKPLRGGKNLAGLRGVESATAGLSSSTKGVKGLLAGEAKVGAKAGTKLLRGIPFLGEALLLYDAAVEANKEYKAGGNAGQIGGAAVAGLGKWVTDTLDGAAALAGFDTHLTDQLVKTDREVGDSIGKVFKELPKYAEKIILPKAKESMEKLGVSMWEETKKLPQYFKDTLETIKKSNAAKDFLDLTKTIGDLIKALLVGITAGIPGVGKLVAKSLLSKEDFANYEYNQAQNDVGLEIELAQKRRQMFIDHRGGSLTENQRLNSIYAETEHIQELRKKRDNIPVPAKIAPAAPAVDVASLNRQSMENSKQSMSPVVLNAPTVATSNSSQTYNQAMITPIDPRNGESTMDRMFATEF